MRWNPSTLEMTGHVGDVTSSRTLDLRRVGSRCRYYDDRACRVRPQRDARRTGAASLTAAIRYIGIPVAVPAEADSGPGTSTEVPFSRDLDDLVPIIATASVGSSAGATNDSRGTHGTHRASLEFFMPQPTGHLSRPRSWVIVTMTRAPAVVGAHVSAQIGIRAAFGISYHRSVHGAVLSCERSR